MKKEICTNQISVRLPDALYQRLLKVVSRTGKTPALPTLDIASFTRWAIKEKVELLEKEVGK